MIGHGYRRMAFVLVALVLLALLATACQSPSGDPYTAGQQFRQMVDEFTQQADQFAKGFCGASPLPLILAALAVFVFGKKAH